MSYNVADMIVEVFEALGESSDLYPYGSTYGTVDLTTAGAQRILKWLNRAYRKVCNTQLADGTFIRFRSLERRVFFRNTVIASTVADVSGQFIQIAGLKAVADKYRNWIIDIGAADADAQGTEQHVVVSNSATTVPWLRIADDFATTPSPGDKVNVYKKWWACSKNSGSTYHADEFIPVDPKEDFLSALWIYDIKTQKDIRRYDERSPLYKQVLVQMYPGMFWDLETPAGGWGVAGVGGGVEFESAPVNGLAFEMHYYGLSEELKTSAQFIMIPDSFSEMIIKWATKTGLLRDREWDGAYAIRKEFETDMQTAIQDGGFRFEYDSPSLWIDS